MKKILYKLALVFISINLNAQFITSPLPDSLSIYRGFSYTSDGQNILAIGKASVYDYYYYVENNGIATVINTPYDLYSNRFFIQLKNYDSICYHLTNDGVYYFQPDGTWDSLKYYNNSLIAKGLYIDGNKKYIALKDSLIYFDGNAWHTFNYNYNNAPVVFREDNGILYFNLISSGIFAFDGQNLTQIINEENIRDFIIYDQKIWYSLAFGYDTIKIVDFNASPIALNIDYPIPSGTACFTIFNNQLYAIGSSTLYVFDGTNLDHLIHNVTYSVNDIEYNWDDGYAYQILNHNNGLLCNLSLKLIFIDPSLYESLGTLQVNQNYKNLNINQVDAWYMNRGQMFWDGIGMPKYEVPKGSGKTASFAGGFWFTANNADHSYASVSRFNNGYDFSPGPLKASGTSMGTTDTSECYAYDHIWKISASEIQYHQMHYADAGYVIPQDILTWPAHGNTAHDFAENLAPFVDLNNNQIYEPEQGDYPCIKGDMSLYWIFNDVLAPHTESENSEGMGLEIHAQAYAFQCDTCTGQDTIINYTTFLNWRVINRSTNNYPEFTAAFWSDADLGDAPDDYIGTHVALNSMVIYNGDNMDGNGNGNTYGANPPALYHSILQGPLAITNDGIDNDNDGTIDEQDEHNLLSGMVYFINGASATGDPENYHDFNNYLNHKWKDNRPLTYGGIGYVLTGGTPAKYMFPGNSDPWMNGTYGIDPNYTSYLGESIWTEASEGNAPTDKRGLAITGPTSLEAGGEAEYTMALIFSRGSDGAYSSVIQGESDVSNIINQYNNTNIHDCGFMALSIEEKHNAIQNEIRLLSNPVSDVLIVINKPKNSTYRIIDIKGQVILNGPFNDDSISTASIEKGVYILEIIDDQKNLHQLKFIKE
ncbi:MAG: T9SS type A sorting domain-containing protein [Bacteroidales bacterium]|nr:T9SS type A sorting domain-containing protein [Bacteroidales bacterium]